jgi:hypothetical protein
MTHDELVEVASKWLSKPWRNAGGGHGACSVIITEMTTAAWEIPDAIGFHNGRSTLVECKASITDFKSDKNKYFRQNPEMGMGTSRYFMVPKGLLRESKIPNGWGVIEVSDNKKTRVTRVSEVFEADHRQETTLLLSLLCRLKVDPGRHIKVRTYQIDDGKEPRATAHIRSKTQCTQTE